MDIKGKSVKLHDMCLRDGMHAKRHQISIEQMVAVATALDGAGGTTDRSHAWRWSGWLIDQLRFPNA